MLALYGMTRAEHNGRRQDWFDRLAPEDRALCRAAVDQALKGDEFKVDFRVRRLDTGEMRWLHARARAIMDEKGRPEKLIGINMDITDRKRAEEEVRKARDGLEERVRDRTQELETVYTSLQRSEARYKDLFNQANDVIFTTDLEGRITSANRKAAEVFLPGKPVQHLSIGDLLTPESAGRAADVLRRAVAANSDLPDEQPWDFEAWTKDGNLVSLEVTARFMREDGVVTGIHGIARDVTQRKKMQEEMAKLLSAVEHAGDGIFMLSPDRRYTYVNSAFARMYGYTADEMVGNSPVMTRSDAHPDSFHEAIYSELLAGNTWTGRQTRKKQDGTLVEIETTLVPIRDKYGTTIQYVGVDRDITRQLEIEQQLRQKQKMEAIGTLAGGIAHDFNNMLAVILGNSELALDDLDGTDAKRNIEQVIKASKRARDLIKQILTFSRKSERGKNVFQLTPLVKETFKLLRSSLPSTIRMKLDIRAANDYIAGDPSQVQQVLMNLAGNAAHAMQPGGGSLLIAVSDAVFTRRDKLPDVDMKPGGYVKLRVKDTGAGIPEDVQKRMFEPFFTTKDAGHGTGMGLAVAYGIVKSHQGAISVDSKIGEGSTFTVFLPSTEPPMEETEQKIDIPGGTERILFVDDEPAVVEMGALLLRRLGYDVTTARKGLDAFEIFLQTPNQYDLLITDQTMPDLVGFELAKKVLKIRKDLPVILVTGFSESVSKEKALAAGVREFLIKPVSKEVMAGAIRRVLDSAGGTPT